MTLLRRRVRDAARRPFVAAGTVVLVAGVAAFGASSALPARAAADDESAEVASLRSALERAFVAAERDHGIVRSDQHSSVGVHHSCS